MLRVGYFACPAKYVKFVFVIPTGVYIPMIPVEDTIFALLDTIQLVTKHFVVLQYLINFPNNSNSHIIFRSLIDAYYQK